MSRSPDARSRDDGGFTLIEVMVALGLFLVVTTAVLPQVIAGLRATATARDVTQAKGVAQAQVERIRNLPFFVGRSAGDYIDVLDTYYRNVVAPSTSPTCGASAAAFPKTEWTGYVAAASARCAYEPAGAFYRKVVNPVVAPGLGAFALVVDAQFLTSDSTPAPVTPRSTYDSQVAGRDNPDAMQLAITVTVHYDPRRGDRYTSVYSQVDRISPAAPLVVSEAKVSTLRISSMSDRTTTLTMDTGVVNLAGELFTGSRVSAFANAGVAANSLGAQATAASTNAVAPPDVSYVANPAVAVRLNGSCNLACFGNSQASGVSAAASDGLPRAGAPLSPVQAGFPQGTSSGGLSFSNTVEPDSRLRLAAGQPMVSLDSTLSDKSKVQGCAFINSSDPAVMRATGYLNTTKGTTSTVDACVTAQSSVIRLFPTDFAPDGVVKISLEQARTRCTVTTSGSSTASAVADFRATMQWMTPSGYSTPMVFTEATAASAGLSTVPLTTAVKDGLRLSDYISSWRSLGVADVARTASGRDAEAALRGVVSVDTVGTRGGDETSVISLQVGALSCKAGDYR